MTVLSKLNNKKKMKIKFSAFKIKTQIIQNYIKNKINLNKKNIILKKKKIIKYNKILSI